MQSPHATELDTKSGWADAIDSPLFRDALYVLWKPTAPEIGSGPAPRPLRQDRKEGGVAERGDLRRRAAFDGLSEHLHADRSGATSVPEGDEQIVKRQLSCAGH